MGSRGMGGQGVEVPVPAGLRQYFLSAYTITSVHGRKRSGHATKAKHGRHLHGRQRSERAARDPWHNRDVGSGRR